jgi:secondary thiamine-phosphate synthase enzyme
MSLLIWLPIITWVHLNREVYRLARSVIYYGNMVHQKKLRIATHGRGFYPLERKAQAIVKEASIPTGLCHIYIPHTSASIIISENADPTVLQDLEKFMSRLVEDGNAIFQHIAEGTDDMSAHVRTVLTQTAVSIPITDHSLALGVWQGIFLWEHRHHGHQRDVIITIL